MPMPQKVTAVELILKKLVLAPVHLHVSASASVSVDSGVDVVVCVTWNES